MAYVNKVILVGKLGKDAEMKHTQSGKPYCSVGLATETKYKGERKTSWHNLIAWDKTAELLVEYGRKGCECYVEGAISYYERDGVKYTNIHVNHFQMTGARNKPAAEGESGRAAATPDDGGGEDIPF